MREAEIRNPTYINFIDNMEYETEVERIINDSYNNLFDKYEQEVLDKRENNELQEELSRI